MKFITHIPKGWVEIVKTLRDEGLEFNKINVALNYKVPFINKITLLQLKIN